MNNELYRELNHLRREIAIYNRLKEADVDKAVINIDKRLEGMNEFRRQIDKMIETLITRVEFGMLQKQVNELRDFQTRIMALVAAGLVLMPIIIWLLNKFVK